MPTRQLDFPVFDADNHMYETPEALTRHLPARITTAAVGGLVSLLSVITLGRHLLA